MPLPKNRSTSVRKVHKRTPKGKTIHYKRRVKGKTHSCGLCGSKLQGVTSSKKAKPSSRKPNRKFGGSLCTSCASRVVIVSSRLKDKSMKLSDVEIRMLKYVK